MQKVINTLAVVSFVVSGVVVGSGVYVYMNRESLVDKVKTEVTDAVKDLLGASQLGSALINGPAVSDDALGVDTNPPVSIPSVPF